MKAPKLTPAQLAALAHVTRAWDAANAREHQRWGEGLRGGVSVTTGAHGDVRDVRTLHAIHALGLIELVATRRTDNQLNRGAFGRWIGGSHDVSYTTFTAKPTALGRAVLRG
mgnify:FL=1